jgi:hypothetical protein
MSHFLYVACECRDSACLASMRRPLTGKTPVVVDPALARRLLENERMDKWTNEAVAEYRAARRENESW